MEKCCLDGKIIYSFEVAESYEFEKEIRFCRELVCCDPECNAPVIYKHGAVRRPYFAHANSAEICPYDCSERKNSELFKKLREMVFLAMKKRYGSAVRMDALIIGGHYTPVAVCLENARYAIDIADRRITAAVLSERRQAYSALGYTGLVISADEAFDCDIFESEDIYFPLRSELNEAHGHTAVVIDRKELQPCYMRLYSSEYSYGKVFSRFFELDELALSDKGFYVQRLDGEFDDITAERAKAAAELAARRNAAAKSVTAAPPPPPLPSHSAAAGPAAKAFDPMDNYRKTGCFTRTEDDGSRTLLSLEEIKINKSTVNYFSRFSDDKIRSTVRNAIDGTVTPIETLMFKLLYADEKEREAFVRAYEELLNSDGEEDSAEILRILEYAFEETGFFT
ncbi:MAG: hypothetical protein MSJ26_00060 [Oscillospiraceae bacterium]|nr:hypothetical protein [Oscillospiraceae bacterium]